MKIRKFYDTARVIIGPRMIFGAMSLGLIGISGCTSMEHVLTLPTASQSVVADYAVEPYSAGIHLFDPVAVNKRVTSLKMQQEVSNLFVLLAVPEREEEYRGIPLNVFAREIFRRFNRTLPHIPLSGGAWRLGHEPRQERSGGYVSVRVEHDLDSGGALPSIGTVDVAEAIDLITDISSKAKGKSALLLIGDFRRMDRDIDEALQRFRQFGEFKSGFKVLPTIESWDSATDVHCVFSINLKAKFSDAFLDSIDGCGFSVAADKIAQPQGMAHFVERVFYSSPIDSDRDGVYDYLDECPNEGRGRIVDISGCPRFDGVM